MGTKVKTDSINRPDNFHIRFVRTPIRLHYFQSNFITNIYTQVS